MSDEQEPGELETVDVPLSQPAAAHDDADDAVDLISIVETDARGRKVVGLDKLIDQRKAAKTLREENAALKAKLGEYQGLDEKVQRVMPIAEAVDKDPELGALIRSTLDGTRKSRPATDQPADDPDALAYAQDLNLVTEDAQGNKVWDVARAGRLLDRATARAEKRMQPQIATAREAAFGMRGEQNLAALYQMQTPDGEPLASDESIREVMKESGMPMPMLADPRVARTVGLMAAGLDREKGRAPKAPIEPIYFERAGGRRGESTNLTEDDRRLARKVGLTDEDLKFATAAKPNRRGEVDLE